MSLRLLIVVLLGLFVAPFIVNAHDQKHVAVAGNIHAIAPFARATPGPAKNGAAYLKLVNKGADDRLIAARSDVAKSTEIHTHKMDGDVMRMRKIDALELPGGEPTVLEPGGDHIMFLGLHKPLKEGESFPLTLVFEKAGEMTFEVNVKGVGAKSDHGHDEHHGHKKKHSH